MSDRQKRMETLGKRFTETPAVETARKSKAESNNRKRHSVYIDADLMKRIDTLFKEVQHDTYPVEVTKSLFLEKLLEKGLQDLEAVKSSITA